MTRNAEIDWGLLVMRLGYASLLIGLHGGARFLRAFNYVVLGQPWTFVSLVENIGLPFAPVFAVMSALAESIAALFVALGLFTRWAALLIVIDMTVALYNEISKGDPFELPSLYFLGALLFVIAGAGRYSIDGFRSGIRQPPASLE